MNKYCSVENCGKKHFSGNYCTMHYARLKRNGHLNGRHIPSLQEIYDKYSLPMNKDGCIEWSKPLMSTGYGQIQLNGKMKLSHRLSWELHNGDIPKGMCVLHKCDNRGCVNPDHLWLGSKGDNNTDRHKKGRTIVCKGEDVYQSKLDRRQIILIRKLIKIGLLQKVIAKIFNVSRTAILHISKGETWKHIK